MRAIEPLQFFLLFCLSCNLAIYSKVFGNLYPPSKHLEKKITINSYLLIFFIGTCFYRIIDGWRLTSLRKITHFDVWFLTVHNGFALIQLFSVYILYADWFHRDSKYLVQQALLLADWSLLPLFAWIFVWSRHVRLGWSLRANWIVVSFSIFSFFLCILHQPSFYFLIGVAAVLSCISLYETNKVHYYRHQVTPLVIALLILHIIFLFIQSLKLFGLSSSSLWAYAYVLSFTLITSLTNRLHLRILIDVNQYK